MQLFVEKIQHTVNSKEMSEKKYYKCYTLLFIIISIGVYASFLYNGKSFVFGDTHMGGDGLVQHYNSFVYYGKYLREIVKTLLFEHRLEIPMWDMSIGYGQDIITTLSYYVIGDPFSFLSIFIPTKYAELGYSFLIYLRLYCAGFAFSAYCRYRGHKSFEPMIGSFIYVFAYYGLYISILHPYFTLPMIYLPLLLIGVEKMLTEKKKVYYTGMLALAAVSNFYFFYMLCIVIVLYTIFRYIEIFGKIRAKELCYWIGIFVIYSLIGILMASVLLIPSIMNILSASRVNVENYIPLLYDLSYYVEMIPTFINGGFGKYYTFTGYTAIALIAIIVLFFKRKEKKQNTLLLLGFIILMLFLMIPFAGHIFNGAGYVTNRWVWALTMLVAYIVVCMLPELKMLESKHWKILFIVSLIYSAIILGIERIRSEKNILAALFLIIAICATYYIIQKKKTELITISSLCMVVIMLCTNAFYLYSPTEGNYISKFTDIGKSYDLLVKDSPEYILRKIKDDDIYRFDTAAIGTDAVKRNSAMLLDMNGVAYYFSSTNDTVTKFNTDLYMMYQMDQTYNNLDRRSILEMLYGVKYIIIPEGCEKYLPYGYNHKERSKDGYVVYSCDTALPIGFTSDTYINSIDYENLDVIEKQEALLNTIVLEGENALEHAQVSYSGEELPYTVIPGDGIEYSNGKIIVSKENAVMAVQFNAIDNTELYLAWDNLGFESVNPYSLYSSETLDDMSTLELHKYNRAKKTWTEPTETYIKMESAGLSTTLVYKTWKDNYYCGHKDFLGNLGYSQSSRTGISVTFAKTGTYTFDELRVVSQPMQFVEQGFEQLTEDTLRDLEINANEVRGQIQLEENKVLCVQIPYNQGWKAYVDGQEVTIHKANGAFMGILLSEGSHSIVFKYATPYLGMSIAISMIGLLFYIVMVIKENIIIKKCCLKRVDRLK